MHGADQLEAVGEERSEGPAELIAEILLGLAQERFEMSEFSLPIEVIHHRGPLARLAPRIHQRLRAG